VHSTLRALFSDLEIRCDVLLRNLPAGTEAPVAQRVAEVGAKVSMLRSEAMARLRDTLEDPALAQVHYDEYAKLNRTLVSLEQFELPALMRWAGHDREITQMCSAFLDQIGWPFPLPLVATVSHEYYVALPSRSIIYVPENENERLLAIGDLAHELGHIVLEREMSKLVRDTPNHIMALAAALASASSEPSGRAFEVGTTWVKWLPEFICDAVATYLTGPAFPLQNLRLCGMQNVLLEAFDVDDGRSHPPDDARMQLALQMLRILAMGEHATAIGELWDEAVAVTAAVPDTSYTEMFPAELLEVVARNVNAGCSELGLRPYDPGLTEGCDVARLAAAAWEQLLADPAGYAEWERERLGS